MSTFGNSTFTLSSLIPHPPPFAHSFSIISTHNPHNFYFYFLFCPPCPLPSTLYIPLVMGYIGCEGLYMADDKLPPALYTKGQSVKDAYKRCLVYEDALSYVGVTDEERTRLEDNRYYWADIKKIEFDARADLIETLSSLIKGGKSGAEKLQAVKMLGEVIYPERFGKGGPQADNVQVKFYIPDNGRHGEV